jgi:hypothetical protein
VRGGVYHRHEEDFYVLLTKFEQDPTRPGTIGDGAVWCFNLEEVEAVQPGTVRALGEVDERELFISNYVHAIEESTVLSTHTLLPRELDTGNPDTFFTRFFLDHKAAPHMSLHPLKLSHRMGLLVYSPQREFVAILLKLATCARALEGQVRVPLLPR